MSDRYGSDLFSPSISPMRLEMPDAVHIMRSGLSSRHTRVIDDGDAAHESNRRRAQRIDTGDGMGDPEFDPAL